MSSGFRFRSLRRWNTRKALAVSIVGLVVGGFGTIGGTAGAASRQSVAQASAIPTIHNKVPIRLGRIGIESGPSSTNTGGYVQFATAYIRYLNSHGGIDGHQIAFTDLDDAGQPANDLLDVETLWSLDHVDAIVFAGSLPPYSYLDANQIPLFGCNTLQCFGSLHPTLYPLSSAGPSYDAQVAHFMVKTEHKPIKIVAELYNPLYQPLNAGFTTDYWHKLGASTVYFDPSLGPAADCTSYVLKWKSEGVQFMLVDLGATQFIPCAEAMQTLGWHPPLGFGGVSSSAASTALLLGPAVVGAVAGATVTEANGEPIYTHAQTIDKIMVGAMRTYYPQYANSLNLNGGGGPLQFAYMVTAVHMIQGALEKYGKVTPELVNQFTVRQLNYNNGLQPPYPSFSKNCKTGADGTTWGFWHYNTSVNPAVLTNLPQLTGNQWDTSAFLGLGKCFLTSIANQLFPGG